MTDPTPQNQSVPMSVYLAAVKGRQEFRRALRLERERVAKMRSTLEAVRSKGICAGAAFVRENPDRDERVIEVLDMIDEALAS